MDKLVTKEIQPLITKWENLLADVALDEARGYFNRNKASREQFRPSLTDLTLELLTQTDENFAIRGRKQRKEGFPMPQFMWVIPLNKEGSLSEEMSLDQALESLKVEPKDIDLVRIMRGVSADTDEFGKLTLIQLILFKEGMEIVTFESPGSQRRVLIKNILLSRRTFIPIFFGEELVLLCGSLTNEFWPEVKGIQK